MSSAAQALANRQNSLHSTGPVTAAGKAASSMNSTRHGLTSKQIVLPGEDVAQYDELRHDMLGVYAPATATERTLVEELAAASWRLLRARRQETYIIQKLVGSCSNPDAGFAGVFMEKPKEVERLMRYITAIERAYYRALNKLEKVQKERALAERQAAIEQAAFALHREQKPKPPNGFVSQSVARLTSVPPAAVPTTSSEPLVAAAAAGMGLHR